MKEIQIKGSGEHKTNEDTRQMKSLILAQDKRWRRA